MDIGLIIALLVLGSAVGFAAGLLGFIYLPALLEIVFGSVATAPLGARIAHNLPVKKPEEIVCLRAVPILAGYMLWKAVGYQNGLLPIKILMAVFLNCKQM